MTDHLERLHDAALHYTRQGWRVIPLWPITPDGTCACTKGNRCKDAGKHPIWTDWTNRGTVSAPDVWSIWKEDHPGANIGIVTSMATGMWVLDVDPDKGGNNTLRDLIAEHGPLPITRIHRTGSGGTHYLFTWPDFPVPTTSGSLGQGLDTRGAGNGMIVAPPSVSGKGVYNVALNMPPAPAPTWLLDRLHEIGRRRAKGREVKLATAEPVDIGSLPLRLRDRIALLSVTDRSAHFHGTVAACRRAGLTQGQTVTALALWCDVVEKFTGRVEAEVARSWGKLDDADPANDPDRYTADLPPSFDRPKEDTPADPLITDLHTLIKLCRTYQDLPDPSHILVTLAVAVTRDIDDDPVWLLLVAPPSSGKTETVRSLDTCAEAHLDDVTAAGLLSWKSGKNPHPTGVLTRIGDKALVSFGDLSTLLADSDRGRRDATFGLLRRAYDGHVTRDLGNAPETLTWRGKLTVIGAVTGVIDNYAAHADALGPRWVYFRLPERDTLAKRQAAALARSGNIKQLRADTAALSARIVYAARARINEHIDVPNTIAQAVEDAALVTCWGRAAVPRHGYGRREIDGMPVVEEPPRLIRQLLGLCRGLLALGLPEPVVTALARRCALDSMPAARLAVLDALRLKPRVSTAELSRVAGLHRKVTRMRLEELELIGVVESHREGEEPADDDVDRRPTTWQLDGEDGELIARVLELAEQPSTAGLDSDAEHRWYEMWVPTPQPPNEEGAETKINSVLGGSNPHFVPPKNAGQNANGSHSSVRDGRPA